jgi:ubiquinone/menaquinone biosynthesis C-methylase UbiE
MPNHRSGSVKNAEQQNEIIVGPRRWFFDAWSRVYDFPVVQRATYQPVQDAVIQALKEISHARVLDIGCGTGLLASRVIETFPRTRVVGCDFSGGMLAHAAVRAPSVNWVQGDACRLPFADQAFDAIVSTEAFHWFPDQAAALAEFFRVLRLGGWLLLAVMNTPAASLSTAVHLGSRLLGEPFYWPSNREMRGWVQAAGFHIGRRERVFRLPGLLFPPVLTCAMRPTDARPPPHRARRRRRSKGVLRH